MVEEAVEDILTLVQRINEPDHSSEQTLSVSDHSGDGKISSFLCFFHPVDQVDFTLTSMRRQIDLKIDSLSR